jgi:hypothetical protein
MASNQNKRKKPDITLMTILAYESTDASKQLLEKYNRPKAKDYKDLELKLAELYFDTTDKKTLEQEMAEIHPHKNWMFKTLPQEPKIIEVEKEVIVEVPVIDTKSNFNDNDCPQDMSSFNGSKQSPLDTIQPYLGIMGVFATIGLTFYFLSKNK